MSNGKSLVTHVKSPIIRQVSIPGSIPNIAVLVVSIVVGMYLSRDYGIILGATFFLLLRFALRAIPRDHGRGIRLVRQQQFGDAIPCFLRSFEFFQGRPWLDKYRRDLDAVTIGCQLSRNGICECRVLLLANGRRSECPQVLRTMPRIVSGKWPRSVGTADDGLRGYRRKSRQDVNLVMTIVCALVSGPKMRTASAILPMAICMLLCPCLPASEAEPARPVALRCEYLENPLGVDVLKPQLSWITESKQCGWTQGAYQILVASSEEILEQDEAMFGTAARSSPAAGIDVAYEGMPLSSRMRCFWKVRCCGQRRRQGTQPGANRRRGRWGCSRSVTGQRAG